MTSLTRTWAILIALTALSLGAGRAGHEGSIGLLGIGLVLLAATFKANQILTHFLGLQRAGSGWRILFRTMLILFGVVIFGIYSLLPLLDITSQK